MQRTNTASTTVFHIRGPEPCTFDFSPKNSIHITVPGSSRWYYWYHWHAVAAVTNPGNNSIPCQSIECLGGGLQVFLADAPPLGNGDLICGKGRRVDLPSESRCHWHHAWTLRAPKEREDLIVSLVADKTLHRNICSAILDRDIYPGLASTPWWVRLILSTFLWISPSLHAWFLDKILAIQLRAIFWFHGVWIFHGHLPILFWWRFEIGGYPRPPLWARKLDWKATHAVAVILQWCCYWVGRLLLGMKGRYPEYTPEGDNSAIEGAEPKDYDISTEQVKGFQD